MAVLLLLLIMSNTNIAASADNLTPAAIFHDFLGSNSSPKPAAGDPKPPSPPPSTSAGRPPLSTSSDLASERQGGSHFEGIPYYGPRSELSGHEIGNRFAGSKRSSSDSTFISSSRDGRFPQTPPDSLDNSNLIKMIRSAGGERSRRVREDETVFNMQQIRPNSGALILQPNATRWDRSASQMSNSIVQYPPRAAQLVPFGYNLHHQLPPNRFSGPSIISQTAAAADEGSRTGIKGSGILCSSGILDRNLAGGAKLKSGARASEPESSTPSGRTGFPSSNRQMTIFYGGQAHVFDDVHPNKADVIMALAGSNGGSWSTNYLPKSAGSRIPTTTGDNNYMLKNSGNETGSAGNSDMAREFRTRLPVAGSSSHLFGPDSIQPAGSILMKDARNVAQIAEASNGDKQDV